MKDDDTRDDASQSPGAAASGAEDTVARPGRDARRVSSIITKQVNYGERALQSTRQLLEKDPKNTELQDWYAFQLYSSGRYEEAIVYYRELHRLPSAKPEYFYYYANCLYCLKNVEEAMKLWKKVVAEYPDRSIAAKARAKMESVSARGETEGDKG